jgi:HB1, ASXL, restriction endonuclease HTH domain
MAVKKSTWQKAIYTILSSSPTALHYKEITERIIAQSLRKSLGATPAATVNAQITESIKQKGAESPYVRVAKGTFWLRERPSNVPVALPKLTPDVTESGEDEPQYGIITSFGMFWRRSDVEWVRTPKLLGVTDIGATPVDFYNQYGIYLLYDSREVIYVGRTTDRPLGLRLYEHTTDRLATRWDRFSWFGLRPVSDAGKLEALPERYKAAELIPALEAVLVEAVEPRQNRKRGDDLATVEYRQQDDPEIKKRRFKQSLDAALDKL